MWKVLAKSVQGIGHRRTNLPCQDACRTSVIDACDRSFLVLAASDGAGSATHSDIGSATSCRVILEVIVEDLNRLIEDKPVTREHAIAWYERVRQSLDREAATLSVPVRELACTLLVAVIGESNSILCQIGDGAIVVRDGSEWRPVFWPQSGEYANTTNFITSPKFDSDLMFESREGRIDEIALFTDGLQTVALNYALQQAHQPFFNPLFDSLRKHSDPAVLAGPMQAFLESPSLAERTDDDLTLVLASRIAEHDSVL